MAQSSAAGPVVVLVLDLIGDAQLIPSSLLLPASQCLLQLFTDLHFHIHVNSWHQDCSTSPSALISLRNAYPCACRVLQYCLTVRLQLGTVEVDVLPAKN